MVRPDLRLITLALRIGRRAGSALTGRPPWCFSPKAGRSPVQPGWLDVWSERLRQQERLAGLSIGIILRLAAKDQAINDRLVDIECLLVLRSIQLISCNTRKFPT